MSSKLPKYDEAYAWAWARLPGATEPIVAGRLSAGNGLAHFNYGAMLSLTPAYDICPQGRAGQEATQAMLITGDNRASRVATCIEAAHHFLLSKIKAIQIVETQLRCIATNWATVCDVARLSETERNFFWGRQFLNPYAFTALEGDANELCLSADNIRKETATSVR